ncbi:hypothetical protein [Blastococcus sp. TF02A-26]|uniref:hypothetical protein n=1 Tax=Blastococcus sp. TF02A-26 TaxID=2250577 RepID=UPI000DEAD70E|nr:hypothetical protein [Blastococcus sp. TF02A-26]RBY83110.1 hypothetical protein DQ240_16990 [Blastococcus sp. TF02A-26]
MIAEGLLANHPSPSLNIGRLAGTITGSHSRAPLPTLPALIARAERLELLGEETDLFYPARLRDDGDLVQPASDVEAFDVVDEVIETVLQRRGWVALLDDGALQAEDRIALTVRRG